MKITIETINSYHVDSGSIYNTIKWAFDSKEVQYPINPTKPHLSPKHTSEDAKQYAINLDKYETIEYPKFREEKAKYQAERNEIESVVIEFIKEESGLNTIPEQYRDKIYSKAYKDGHSGGYYEVYNHLLDLIEIFN